MYRAQLKITLAESEAEWMDVLSPMQYDFYHLPRYHQLAFTRGEGEGILISYSEAAKMVALPLLLRTIPNPTNKSTLPYKDATSVYGYAGPVATPAALGDPEFLCRFQKCLHQVLLEMGIVSVFSRLHPILSNHDILTGLGTVVPLGRTVSIDLRQPVEDQFAQYRKSHRYEIRRAQATGIRVKATNDEAALTAFRSLYCRTMQRLNAADSYFFDSVYFQRLAELQAASLRIFLAELHGELCAAALFIHTCNFVQYHLSASNLEYAKLAPTKLIIDEARLWAVGRGAHYLHLGGGVASHEDQLYRMKSGFSHTSHQFYVWNWIVNAEAYQQLVCEGESRRMNVEFGCPHTPTFFPLYREGANTHNMSFLNC